MRYANFRECQKAGYDPGDVERIARNLSRWALRAENMGITIFGGTGTGTLRFMDADGLEKGPLILADIDGRFDGGDGGSSFKDDDLLRGES